MTGVEPIAIAGKVVGAAVKAERGDAEERKALRDLAKESGALDPAARAYAKRLAVKEHIRMKIWQPLGMFFGISREYFENDFADDMAERLAEIPEEDLITPRFSVAGPAVQGIAFTVDEDDLRSMYLNLLAAASDARRAETAHPSFAEIIRQLSPEEAVLLGPVLSVLNLPIVEIRLLRATPENPDESGFNVYATHVLEWEGDQLDMVSPGRSLMVVNWQRLGLVAVDYTKARTMVDYDWVEEILEVSILREKLDTEGLTRVRMRPGILEVTPYGEAFYNVVIQPSMETAAEAPLTDVSEH